VVDWSGREVGRLLTRFIDDPAVAEQLMRLRGTWPFNVTSRCKQVNTLDTDYREFSQQGTNIVCTVGLAYTLYRVSIQVCNLYSHSRNLDRRLIENDLNVTCL